MTAARPLEGTRRVLVGWVGVIMFPIDAVLLLIWLVAAIALIGERLQVR